MFRRRRPVCYESARSLLGILAGKLAEQAVRTTLVVAAMEAGYQFETGQANELMQGHLTEAAKEVVRNVR